MFSNIGMPEIILILLVVLLVFGAKRLPEMGSAMGKGIREFKKSIRDVQESVDAASDNPPPTRQLDAAASGDGEPKKLSQ
ncbi:MAG: twin-arginine translocase TatA/TatE family subunit [Gemmatimonadetes bacterium]|nr:twin-arginine translocase TatA/TatE family subunit [Gemmatimonadota bacterium]